MHVRASTDHGEPSAQENTKNGGRKWHGHDDGLGDGAPKSSCAVRWLTERSQRAQVDAVSCWGGGGVLR